MADRLTPEQIYSITASAGFADPVRATAVVLGESGGDPRAVNRNSDSSIDRGLWQINSRWHPDVSEADAFSVARSTAYALTLSKGGTDFSPWAATRASTFPTHLRTAEAAKNDETLLVRDVADARRSGLDQVKDAGGAVVDAVGGIVSPFAGLVELSQRVLGVLTSGDFWRRAGLVIIGAAAVILGLVALFGRDVASTVVAGKTGGAVDISETE